jgi:hypothetical protein
MHVANTSINKNCINSEQRDETQSLFINRTIIANVISFDQWVTKRNSSRKSE